MKDRRERRVSRRVWQFSRVAVWILLVVPFIYVVMNLPQRAFNEPGFQLLDLAWVFVVVTYGSGALHFAEEIVTGIFGSPEADGPVNESWR